MDVNGFCKQYGIRVRSERWHENPHAPDWREADHWKVTLLRRDPTNRGVRRQITFYFSKGFAHNGTEPEAAEVLDRLASGAAAVENAPTFEDWAGDLGYDPDSRKAEAIYQASQELTMRLWRFLGDDRYEMLLWKIERLVERSNDAVGF